MHPLLLALAIVVFAIFNLWLLLPTRYIKHSPLNEANYKQDASRMEPKVSVQVLVLGDIGHSPRMQYHAMSIAKHGGRVDMIGYYDFTLIHGLTDNPLITIVPLSTLPRILRSKSLPFLLTGPFKVIWQICSLLHALLYCTRPARWLLVQNPPSIPTLLVAFIVSFLRNTHLIIDWHNYGWSILSGTRGASHPFVRISKYYEAILGSWAPTASFTVTNAMARQLRKEPYNFRSPILTLHDRPAAIFQPITTPQERRTFFERLPETAPYAKQIDSGKMKLLVSSTSWTPDEDFSILLSALQSYSAHSSSVPPLLLIITGKGPQKAMYLSRIEHMDLKHVTIATAWLSSEDYASLLACADLGVCLHMSSSGVDLPMKVVDMFGAGLPVVGYRGYESWPELVLENVNGKGFVDSEELVGILIDLLGEREGKQLERLREGARSEGSRRWDEEWDEVAGRLIGVCD